MNLLLIGGCLPFLGEVVAGIRVGVQQRSADQFEIVLENS
jgi:hypothetical protein